MANYNFLSGRHSDRISFCVFFLEKFHLKSSAQSQKGYKKARNLQKSRMQDCSDECFYDFETHRYVCNCGRYVDEPIIPEKLNGLRRLRRLKQNGKS